MPKVELKPLTIMPTAECWSSEADDLTPWLAEPDNLRLLSDKMDMELEVVAREKYVGPYRADLLCKDIESGRYVVIENQLTLSDHKHLGQLLTYGASLDVLAFVWIAPKFANEHKAVLEWLNRVTDESVNVFAFTINVIRVGNEHGIRIEDVVLPNNLTKRVRQSAREKVPQGDFEGLKDEYWSRFKTYLENRGKLQCPDPNRHHNLDFRFNISGARIAAIANSMWEQRTDDAHPGLRVQLVLENQSASRIFDSLLVEKSEIERAVGEPLQWRAIENVKRRRIYVHRNNDISIRTDWPKQFEWIAGHLESFHQVFVPKIRALVDA